ncbi:MAG: sulfatase [Verrucomicrobiota bacterium]
MKLFFIFPTLLLVWSPCLLNGQSGTSEKSPNVLFITIDDLNRHVGFLDGIPAAPTPHLDRLAASGVNFTNAHCAVPACNPSRTAVLTGVAPYVSGVYLNKQDWRECSRLSGVATLPEVFRSAGYVTRGGGKIYHAHSLNSEAFTGFHDPKPWESYFPHDGRQMPDELLPEGRPDKTVRPFYKGLFDWAPLDCADSEIADGQVVDWAVEHLGEKSEQPLFLAVGIYRPHIPWYTPQRYFDASSGAKRPVAPSEDLDDIPEAGQAMARRHWHEWMIENELWEEAIQGYLASAAFADAQVGRLLEALEAGPLGDNTVVVVWSDHGYHLGQKEHWEKFALWNQATQVQLLWKGPGIARGLKPSAAVSLLDIFPTLCDLCGVPVPQHCDGETLLPLLTGESDGDERVAVITHGRGNHAIQDWHWRFIRYEDGSEEVYDHRNDREEHRNLASECPRIIARLASHLPTTEAPNDPEPTAK